MATETPATTTPAVPGARVDRSLPKADETSSTTAGTTVISDGVVAKVAGIAAREIPGVHALGGGGARALGAIRNAINAQDLGQGVKVEVGETQAAVDLTIVVEYPTPVHQVASQVRDAVAGAITRLVGLEVVEVNVTVDDVHIPGDEDEQHEESRVS
ncbi:Asp23/Gls24 family envelope stress response protein [Microbacterium sp. 11MF]|uniref:Asp23/Gls24 family envelope stress response protein n=1 Tax=Microbacterium sp. 11MF TaxID=1169146 RepID=UPI00037F42EC|nr:Asp23/Gls24 family envelope stress response protein [Microbacterium sp. 11MF]